MFVTAVVVLCKLMVAEPTLAPDSDCTAEEAKIEEIVTDSSMDPTIDFQSCMVTWPMAITKWKSESPLYRSPVWRVARVKCVPGHYEIPGKA